MASVVVCPGNYHGGGVASSYSKSEPFWAEVNGTSLLCAKAGTADATGLVCVHEIGGSHASWDAVLAELGDTVHAMTFDQRGCGRSEKDGSLTLADLVADLNGVCDLHSPGAPIVLTGTALGAAICIAFALAHPSRVAGMVLGSPTARVTQEVQLGLEARADKIRAEGMRAVVDASLAKSYPEALRTNPKFFEQYRLGWIANDPESFCAMSMVPAQLSEAGDISELTCPVLLLGATHDTIRPPDNVEALARSIPLGAFKELDGGHFLNLQNPVDFAAEIKQFIATLPKEVAA